MTTLTNTFKQNLVDKKPQIGLWASLASPYCAEICAGAGFDWLLLDGEHAPNDVPLLLAQLQAVAPYPAHPVLRPPVGDTHLIKQYLDIGAQSLLVPMVDTAEQAKEIVAAAHYPPFGVRGVGSAIARAARWDRIPGYLQKADAAVCVLVQVETRKGLENIDAIAAVAGVDGVFIGPADLAASLGHIGNPAHPEVQDAIERGIKAILKAGKAPGTLVADPPAARKCLSLGCLFVAVGTDVGLLARSTENLAREFGGTR